MLSLVFWFVLLQSAMAAATNIQSAVTSVAPLPETEQIQVLVSTLIGSEFLDKKKKFTISSSSSMKQIKKVIKSKFPGAPPMALQQLVLGSDILPDNTTLDEFRQGNIVSIVLETLSGSSAYNRTLSVTQSIDAYVSTIVQSAYIGKKLQSFTINMSPMQLKTYSESTQYREMFQTARSNFQKMYEEEIAQAKDAERNPELASAYSWRDKSQSSKLLPPLVKALAKEFDLNTNAFTNLLYFSSLLCIFGLFGTASKNAAQLILALIPSMWLSKIRLVRITLKALCYWLIQVMAGKDFILPLFPATVQEISKHFQHLA